MKPEDIEGLKKFYNVNSVIEVVACQAAHIEKLQAHIAELKGARYNEEAIGKKASAQEGRPIRVRKA